MIVRRLNTMRPTIRFQEEMDDLFGNFFGPGRVAPWTSFGRSTFPVFNVWEDDENLYAEAELPGIALEDIDVQLHGHELTIKGQRKDAKEEEGVTFHRRERQCGEFCRVLQLPVEVDRDKVQASMRNGILSVTLPKGQAARPRKIEVKAS